MLNCGSNLLSEIDEDSIERAVASATGREAPREYLQTRVASTVGKIVLGRQHRRVRNLVQVGQSMK